MAEPEASKKAGSSLNGVQQQRTVGEGPGKPFPAPCAGVRWVCSLMLKVDR